MFSGISRGEVGLAELRRRCSPPLLMKVASGKEVVDFELQRISSHLPLCFLHFVSEQVEFVLPVEKNVMIVVLTIILI